MYPVRGAGPVSHRPDMGMDELVDLDKYLTQLQQGNRPGSQTAPAYVHSDIPNSAGPGGNGSSGGGGGVPVRAVVTSTNGMLADVYVPGLLPFQTGSLAPANLGPSAAPGLNNNFSGLSGALPNERQQGLSSSSTPGLSAQNFLNAFRQQAGYPPLQFSQPASAGPPASLPQDVLPAVGATSPSGARGTKKAAPRKAPAPRAPSPDDDDSSGLSNSSDDDVPKSRKKRETGVDDAERRHQALQEKNRRAQRRFRERQKTKIQELHKQIEELTSKVSNLQTENAALQSRTSILEKVLDMRNEQIQVMQESKEVPGLDESELQGMTGHLVNLTPDVIKELSSDQIYKIYQTYVKELSLRLVEVNRCQDGSNTTLQQEVDQLCKDLCLIIMRLGVIKPLETRKFIVVSRQYLGTTEAEVIEMWKQIMKNIDLSEQQKKDIVERKRMFLTKIDPIMEERKGLNVQIQAYLPHDTFHTKNALAYIKAHEAVIKLRENLRAEQHVMMEFAMALFRGVFKPHQMATVLVQAYPAVPDALGIASAMALEIGEQLPASARGLSASLAGGSFMPIHPSLLTGPGPASGLVAGNGSLSSRDPAPRLPEDDGSSATVSSTSHTQ